MKGQEAAQEFAQDTEEIDDGNAIEEFQNQLKVR